ncbi:hypothetical protein ACHHYP_00158 [Achlya hypogyna]|uniref:Transmembrane protein n=1 Tax=Achlya hypogyna TaxID=1202772 RepID=A0A1V9ZBB9_ACHHY|nr:hypothetical protein ACHHYP_00158 [Achlya hypogyna]
MLMSPVEAFATPRAQWDALDMEISDELEDGPAQRRRKADDDDDADGFINDNPDYVRKMLEKKVQAYASHIKEMKARMEKWQAHKNVYVEHIKKLELRLKEQADAFAKAEVEWEQEALALSRAGAGHRTTTFTIHEASGRQGQQELERQKAKEAVRQMLRGAADVNADDDGDDDLSNIRALTWLQRAWGLFRRLVPLTRDIKQIEARYGPSVAAYFVFCRWIILNYMVVSIPALYFLVRHILELSMTDYAAWGATTGFVPKFLLFPSYTSDEAFAYSLFLSVTSALFLLVSTRKWLREDRHFKLVRAADVGKQAKFGKILLNAWDFDATSAEDASDLRKGIWESFHVALYDDIKQEQIRNRTKRERYKLYGRRAVALLVYIIVQVVSWGLIGLLTVEASSFALIIKAQVPALQPYAASIVPLGVSIINGALPTIIGLLTDFERWDDNGFRIKAMVTRLFLAQILNILLQLWSYAMLLDPYLYTTSEKGLSWLPYPYEIRANVMQKFKPDTYACRAEQVASGLVVLVLTNFVTPKVTLLTMAGVFGLVDGAKKLRAQRRQAAFTPADRRSEFLLAPKMVALMYSCTLYTFAIPLCPSSGISTVLLLVLGFKFDKQYLLAFQKKPATPWSAKNAGAFFIKLYWCTIAIYVGGMYWFLTNATLPKACAKQVADTPLICTAYDAASQTCTLNTTNPMSHFFSANATGECSSYPSCICSNACGPFTNVTSGYTPILEFFNSIDTISSFVALATSSVTLVWCLVGLLAMQVLLQINSVEATQLVGLVKDQEAKGQISALVKKLAIQDKKLKLQKLQN